MSGDARSRIPFLTADQIARLAVGAAEEAQPESSLQAIDEVARDTIRQALFTAMAFDEAAMAVERIYTSDAAAYPLGGRKPKRDTAWGRHVLIERRVFIGEGAAAIRDAFSDHDLILSLGLRSVINIPVVFRGRCLGTLNFLWRREHVHPSDIVLARLFALSAAAAFMSGR
jgi:GAF domain-containing protein